MSEASRGRAGPALAATLIGAVLASFAAGAVAQRAMIYTCVDANGKTHTADRPITICNQKDQRVLNADGSLNKVMPPTPTAEERAEMEQRQREADAELALRNDAVRRDRNLVQRFPSEQRHRESREKALDDVRKAVAISEQRIATLVAERKPLDDELEFYKPPNKPPLKLKLALDANEASMSAQKSLILNQQAEVGRINALYDAQLAHLKKLWAGARLGSLPSPVPVAAAPAKTATR